LSTSSVTGVWSVKKGSVMLVSKDRVSSSRFAYVLLQSSHTGHTDAATP